MTEKDALVQCVSALQHLLTFYEDGKRGVQSEAAWNNAIAGAVEAYMDGAGLLEWTIRPVKAINGAVYYGIDWSDV
jgi:hypothetical protein